MKILIYDYSSFEKLQEDLRVLSFDLLIFCFNKKTPYFLSRKYYKILEYLKEFSKNKKVGFIFVFYVKKDYRNLVNGVYISSGMVRRIFGEIFSNKCCVVREKKMIQIMFYYDLYANRNVFNLNDIDLFIGLDNFGADNIKYLQRKFLDKLFIIDGDGKVYNQKNVENIAKKVGKYYIQI